MAPAVSRSAIITGSAKGIGKELALQFARDGFSVALFDANEALLTETHREAEACGVPVIRRAVDVTDPIQVAKAVRHVAEQFRTIDVVVNNAGVHRKGTFSLSHADLELLFAVNVRGIFNVSRAVASVMARQKSGHIFNIASVAGLTGWGDIAGYSASKFAVRGLSESLCRALLPVGVKVTTLSPSWTDTDMAAHAPLARKEMLSPADLMQAIRFTMSLGASAVVKEVVIETVKDLSFEDSDIQELLKDLEAGSDFDSNPREALLEAGDLN